MHIHPEANALVARYPLNQVLGHDIPDNDAPILACGHNKRLALENSKTAANGKTLVLVSLVGLLDASGDVVPQADAVVEVKGQDKAPVRGEADVGDSGVVFVDKGSKTLTR